MSQDPSVPSVVPVLGDGSNFYPNGTRVCKDEGIAYTNSAVAFSNGEVKNLKGTVLPPTGEMARSHQMQLAAYDSYRHNLSSEILTNAPITPGFFPPRVAVQSQVPLLPLGLQVPTKAPVHHTDPLQPPPHPAELFQARLPWETPAAPRDGEVNGPGSASESINHDSSIFSSTLATGDDRTGRKEIGDDTKFATTKGLPFQEVEPKAGPSEPEPTAPKPNFRLVAKQKLPEPQNAPESMYTAPTLGSGTASKAVIEPGTSSNDESNSGPLRAYIKNVRAEITAQQLRTQLEQFGEVTSVELSVVGKNFAFADFKTFSGFQAAKSANPHRIGGFYVMVQDKETAGEKEARKHPPGRWNLQVNSPGAPLPSTAKDGMTSGGSFLIWRPLGGNATTSNTATFGASGYRGWPSQPSMQTPTVPGQSLHTELDRHRKLLFGRWNIRRGPQRHLPPPLESLGNGTAPGPLTAKVVNQYASHLSASTPSSGVSATTALPTYTTASGNSTGIAPSSAEFATTVGEDALSGPSGISSDGDADQPPYPHSNSSNNDSNGAKDKDDDDRKLKKNNSPLATHDPTSDPEWCDMCCANPCFCPQIHPPCNYAKKCDCPRRECVGPGLGATAVASETPAVTPTRGEMGSPERSLSKSVRTASVAVRISTPDGKKVEGFGKDGPTFQDATKDGGGDGGDRTAVWNLDNS